MTTWCICCVASTSIKILCYYLHTNTAVVVLLHSTTVVTLLHVSGYYTGVFSFVFLGSTATTVSITVVTLLYGVNNKMIQLSARHALNLTTRLVYGISLKQ